MAAQEGTPHVETASTISPPPPLSDAAVADTVTFLRALELPVGSQVAALVRVRRKYGAATNTSKAKTLIKTDDVRLAARQLHAMLWAASEGVESASVLYVTPAPRAVDRAAKAVAKAAIDSPSVYSAFPSKLLSEAMSPACTAKAGRVSDIDVDWPACIPDVFQLVQELGLPLVGVVRTRGGVHLLYRPRDYPASDTHTKLVAGLQAVDAKHEAAATAAGVGAPTSLKADRFSPVPGTLQGGHYVTFYPGPDLPALASVWQAAGNA